MKVTPILFSTPMARAAWEGRKTQTRRPVTDCDIVELGTPEQWNAGRADSRMLSWEDWGPDSGYVLVRIQSGSVCALPCPYGKPGDLLWMREAHYVWSTGNMDGSDRIIAYRATEPDSPCGGWTLSIHMPRWASRLTLRLTDVRVERVQDISKVDATAEGFEKEAALPIDPRDWFRNSWDSLNAKRGYGWDANPWVWVLVFEVIRKNVDEVL